MLPFLAPTPAAAQNGNVKIAYLWHLHQPIYWNDQSRASGAPDRYEHAFESIQAKGNGAGNPQVPLGDYFGVDDRKFVYNYGRTWASINSMSGTNRGAQLTYSGSLAENVRSLANNNWNGYNGSWVNFLRDGYNAKTPNGYPRQDSVNFSFHHALLPLHDPEVVYMELRLHQEKMREIIGSNFVPSKGFFPTETCFSTRLIPSLRRAGIEWSIVSGEKIARATPGYPINIGDNIRMDPPNKADQINDPTGQTFTAMPSGDRKTMYPAIPLSYQVSRTKYVNPDTGAEEFILVVPSDQANGWVDGYQPIGTGFLPAIRDKNNTSDPSIVLFAHDGDNAWGGGFSYYQESVPNFTATVSGQGYDVTTIQQFLHQFPTRDRVIHVEDGGWINPDPCFGSPQFLQWNWPLLNQAGNPDPRNGWHEKPRDYAIWIAALNRIMTLQRATGHSPNFAKIMNPDSSTAAIDRAWHYLLGSKDSGNMYYGAANEFEVLATIGCNEAMEHIDPLLTTSVLASETTPPSIWIPQRWPYNPGSLNFGAHHRWVQTINNGDFTIWTFAYDASGIASATLKYRIDNDGTNPLTSNQNETFAGGSEVGAWQSIAMTGRAFPKDNVFNRPEANFFELPAHISNHYYADVNGLRSKLIDYYVEVTDSRGNVAKSPIQHVFIGDGAGAPTPTATPTPTPPPGPANPFNVADGVIDASACQLAGGLYVAEQNGWVYVAANVPTPEDVFIYVSSNPTPLQATNWAKAGQVGRWDFFLAREGGSGSSFASWFGAGTGGAAIADDPAIRVKGRSGNILEGAIRKDQIGGSIAYAAMGVYGTADGGALTVQSPAGNGDGNIDTAEFRAITTGVEPCSGATPTPSATPTVSPTPSVSPTASPSPTVGPTGTPSPTPTATPSPNPFNVSDNTVDAGACQLGANLWLAERDGWLYVAMNPATPNDAFVYVSDNPTELRPANWAKAGQVGTWRFFLAREGGNDYASWFDASGSPVADDPANFVKGRSGSGALVEGAIRKSLVGGTLAYAALGVFGGNDGGALTAQIPASLDSDGDIDGVEFQPITTGSSPCGVVPTPTVTPSPSPSPTGSGPTATPTATPTSTPGTNPFNTGDGTIDAGACQIGTGLYLAEQNGWIYIATNTPLPNDAFLYLTTNPSPLRSANWAKTGQVARWDFFLAREADGDFAGWFDATEALLTANTAVRTFGRSGNVLEGAIRRDQLAAGTVYAAMGAFQTFEGGNLSAQAPPAQTSNGNIEANEFHSWAQGQSPCTAPTATPTPSPTQTVLPNPFNVTDGNIDVGACQLTGGLSLAERDGWLYVAATVPANQDAFIYVSDSASPLQAANWAKAGQVGRWIYFLAAEGTSGSTYSSWFNSAEASVANDPNNYVQARTGNVIEGAIRKSLVGGATARVSLGIFGNADGAALIAQSPTGNGNGTIETAEFQAVTTGLSPCGGATPTPTATPGPSPTGATATPTPTPTNTPVPTVTPTFTPTPTSAITIGRGPEIGTTSGQTYYQEFQDWNAGDLRFVAPHGNQANLNDGGDNTRDLVAFYSRDFPAGDRLYLRADLLDVSFGAEVGLLDVVFLMDFGTPGTGATNWPESINATTTARWEVAVVFDETGRYRIYNAAGNVISSDTVNPISNFAYIRSDLDGVELQVPRTLLTNNGWNGTSPISFQVGTRKDDVNTLTDCIPDSTRGGGSNQTQGSVASNAAPSGRAKFAFILHGNQNIITAQSVQDVIYNDVILTPNNNPTGFHRALDTSRIFGVPPNIHVSATLMISSLWADRPGTSDRADGPEFVSDIASFLDGNPANGEGSVIWGVYAEHIMPFFEGTVNRDSIRENDEFLKKVFNLSGPNANSLFWIPERVVRGTTFADLTATGYNWTILDQINHLRAWYGTAAEAAAGHKINRINGVNVFMINDEADQMKFSNEDGGIVVNKRRDLIDFARSADQEQLTIVFDDWEAYAGRSFTSFGVGSDNPDNFNTNMRWLANKPWVEVVNLEEVARRGWTPVDRGTNLNLPFETYDFLDHATQGNYQNWYHGSATEEDFDAFRPFIRSDLNPQTRSTKIFGALSTYVTSAPAAQGGPGTIAQDVFSGLFSGLPNNRLARLSRIGYHIATFETAWHDEDNTTRCPDGTFCIPDTTFDAIAMFAREMQFLNLRRMSIIGRAAQWAQNGATGVVAETVDVDQDGEGEYLLYNNNVFAVFENDGGRLITAFARNSITGEGVSVLGNIVGFPDFDDEREVTTTGNVRRVSTLSDWYAVGPDRAYVNDVYTVTAQSNGFTFHSPDNNITKTVTLAAGSKSLEVTYQLAGAVTTLYVRNGLSPDIENLLTNGQNVLQLNNSGTRLTLSNVETGASVAIDYAGAGNNASYNAAAGDGTVNTPRNKALTHMVELFGSGTFSFDLILDAGGPTQTPTPTPSPSPSPSVTPSPSPTSGPGNSWLVR